MTNKEIVLEVIHAFLEKDIEKALTFMADDVIMGWPGYFDLDPGKDVIREFFKTVPETLESEMDDLVAEENKVIGTGFVLSRHDDGKDRKSFFSDVYTLENGQVKSIKSYMVFEQTDEQ